MLLLLGKYLWNWFSLNVESMEVKRRRGEIFHEIQFNLWKKSHNECIYMQTSELSLSRFSKIDTKSFGGNMIAICFFFIHFRWDIESKCNCNFYIKHERFVTALVNAASLHERFTNYNERNLISENEIISIRIIRKTSLSCKVFWWCRHDFQNRLASFIKFLIQHQLLSCSFLFFIVFHWTAMLVRCFVEII